MGPMKLTARSQICWITLPTFLTALAISSALPAGVVDDTFFAQQLYPIMKRAQCDLCHNDNGVASGTQLEFPSPDADTEQITAFGLKLLELVDQQQPKESLLLIKPTNREEHSGGERIEPNSDEERVLLDWIGYLSELTEEQVRQAEQRIARAERLGLSKLTVRRLTHSQYNQTVRDLLGDQTRPADSFPQEDYVRGFKNQLEAQGISRLQAEAYGKAAERLALSAFRGGDHLGLLPRQPAAPDDVLAADQFVRYFGLRAFRRPLAESEVQSYVDMCLQEANRSGDFSGGAKLVVEAMLQSPNFLFRIQRGPAGEFGQYEMASRLSYFLWDTMPNAMLLSAAANGEFSTREDVESWARRMLQDPRAVR